MNPFIVRRLKTKLGQAICLLLFFLMGLPFLSDAQTTVNITENDTTGKKEVKIVYSNLLENITDSLGNRITKLSGGVELQQDSVLMFCDTAFKDGNTVVAFGNVIIQQNDSLRVFSDSLVYQGATKVADLFGNVAMESGPKNLFTNYLNYDLTSKTARYTSGALITQGNTKLVSKKGTFYVNTDELFFKDSITVFDSTFTLRADTLLFNSKTQVVTFLGPTLIHQDSNVIYCEDGFYDMETKLAEFRQNAQYVKGAQKATAKLITYDGSMKEIRLEGDAKFVENDKIATAQVIRYEEENENIFLEGNAFFKDSTQQIYTKEVIKYNSETGSFSTIGRSKVVNDKQILETDTLNFDDVTGLGQASGGVFWQDTIEHISIQAENARYNKETSYLKAHGGRPLLSLIDGDTLFLASDTLVSNQASETDTTRLMQAYADVRIFKKDLQGIADSLAFVAKDSLFKLYKNPLLWSDTSQFKADSIFIQMKKGKIDQLFLHDNAFIVTSSDLKFFNQIKGKKITAYFKENELQSVRVVGNAETIYYASDDEEAYLGATKTICSELKIFFKNKNVKNIKFYKQPNSEILPMQQILANPPNLEGFSWDFESRPQNLQQLRIKKFKKPRNNTISTEQQAIPENVKGFTKPEKVLEKPVKN